jgi:hypothetical protein
MPRTYTRTTAHKGGPRTRTVRVEPAPYSDQGPLILITSYDDAGGSHLTRLSCRFPRLSAWRYGRGLRRAGYERLT